MDMRERIARKIGSWPITQWVGKKLAKAMWRKLHKAPEVQKRIEAFRATAPNTLEQQQAFFAYGMALQKELEKSRFTAWPPGSAQIEKLEKGDPSASEIAAVKIAPMNRWCNVISTFVKHAKWPERVVGLEIKILTNSLAIRPGCGGKSWVFAGNGEQEAELFRIGGVDPIYLGIGSAYICEHMLEID